MKKILIITLTVIMAAVMCAPAYAAVNSNHYVDYQKFNADESEWDIFGWTVVDTEIVRLGYVLDGAGIVWIVDSIDVRDNASVVAENDCFQDRELYTAVVNNALANGLTDFFTYRVHITLDTTVMEKGEHTLEVAAEYSDGTVGNIFRDSEVEIVKTKDAVKPVETEPEETDPVGPGEFEVGDCNRDGAIDNKDIVVLFRYVSGIEKEEDETIYDYDRDGEVTNKDVTKLFRDVSAKS